MPGSAIRSSISSLKPPASFGPTADIRRDRRIGRNGLLLLAGNEFHRRQEARRVARREQLLRIRARAAQFLRCAQLHVQLLVE